jgi:uncharacterized protein with PIN domain
MKALKVRSASHKHKSIRHHAKWINDQLVCSCGSRIFTVFREKVARKIHTRTARRRRRVSVCENNHKSAIGFPSTRRK